MTPPTPALNTGSGGSPPLTRWRTRRAPAAVALFVVSIFIVALVAVIASHRVNDRAFYDQSEYHLKTIETFAAQWPHPDLRDYPSATTPGYHLVLALCRRYVTSDVDVLRGLGSLFTVGLLATLALAVTRIGLRPLVAAALCLPVAASPYVFTSGAWLLPDNAGWWGVLAVILVAAVAARRINAWTYAGGGLLLLLTVLVRQPHLWTAALLWTAAWWGDDAAKPVSHGLKRFLAMFAATLPAFLAVAWFAWLWRGGVPPSFQQQHQGPNPAVPAMALAVFGATGVFFLTWIIPIARSLPAERRRTILRLVLIGAAVGVVLGVAPQTTYDPGAGRVSGLWNVAAKLPTFAGRSPLIVGLSALGGAVLGLWLGVLPRRDRWLLLVGSIAFVAAQTMNAEAWQRYYEPMALITHALVAARVAESLASEKAAGGASMPLRLSGPVLLALLLAGITASSLR